DSSRHPPTEPLIQPRCRFPSDAPDYQQTVVVGLTSDLGRGRGRHRGRCALQGRVRAPSIPREPQGGRRTAEPTARQCRACRRQRSPRGGSRRLILQDEHPAVPGQLAVRLHAERHGGAHLGLHPHHRLQRQERARAPARLQDPAQKMEDFTGPRKKSDLGFITFHISADLEKTFDWNVKQLFLYLSAEYSTKSNAVNQVVLWDKILLRGENPKLNLKDVKSKYFFFDDGHGLKGNRNVTLTLSWQVIPIAGILPLVTGSGRVSVPFPDSYEIATTF
uniref:Signal peptidase complex subunit 3 n=1 Tax=Rattus norvegicus TaxID=10116 RepID=A0ABK0L878_RAT